MNFSKNIFLTAILFIAVSNFTSKAAWRRVAATREAAIFPKATKSLPKTTTLFQQKITEKACPVGYRAFNSLKAQEEMINQNYTEKINRAAQQSDRALVGPFIPGAQPQKTLLGQFPKLKGIAPKRSISTSTAENKPSGLNPYPAKESVSFFSRAGNFLFRTPERELAMKIQALKPLQEAINNSSHFTADHIEKIIEVLPEDILNDTNLVRNSLKDYTKPDRYKIHSLLTALFKAGNFYLNESADKVKKNYDPSIKFLPTNPLNTHEGTELLGNDTTIHDASHQTRQQLHAQLIQKLFDRGFKLAPDILMDVLLNNSTDWKGSLRLGAIETVLNADKDAKLLSDINSITTLKNLFKDTIETPRKIIWWDIRKDTSHPLYVIRYEKTYDYDQIRFLELLNHYFAKSKQPEIRALWKKQEEELEQLYPDAFLQFSKDDQINKAIASKTMFFRQSSKEDPQTKKEHDEAKHRASMSMYASRRR